MIKDELQHIIRGTSKNRERTLVETIADYLRASTSTSFVAKNYQQNKQEEAQKLSEFCNDNNLWADAKLNFELFVSEGAEQKVYIRDEYTVYKLNDAIYYAS